MFGRWRKPGEKHGANKQQGDSHALDREQDGVVMRGPGAAPREDESVEERRARDRA